MANYELLKDAVKAVVKANGNEEITGDALQQTLLAIVDALGKGYQFMGLATPTTDPGVLDQKVCYLAKQNGVYSHFGGLKVESSEKVDIFIFDTTWSKIVVSTVDADVVRYTLQNTSDAQKEQARKNIGIPEYVTFDDVTKLDKNLGERLFYVGDKNIEPKSIPAINAGILEIDFDGAKITTYGKTIKGHGHCKLKNATIDFNHGSETTESFCVQGFGYVENVYLKNSENDYSDNHSTGFMNCDHLYNCVAYGGGLANEQGFTIGFKYCNYLIQCRYKGSDELITIGFSHCNFISQCYMSYGQGTSIIEDRAKYGLGTNKNVESLIGILADGSFETFSDIDHLTVGGYNLDNFIKLISSDGGTGKSKLYAKPDDKSGMATVLMDTNAVNWAVARRTASGTLKAKDAAAEDDVVTLRQLNATTDYMIEVTWAELKALRDEKKLKAGQSYRITDFVTTSVQAETRSAGHAFDIIVIADDAKTLNENARAILHNGDTYFNGCKVNAWELKYCLDNDANRFAWADTENGKGVVWWMKDEWDNECFYDFKNIQYKRYKVTAVTDKDRHGTFLNGYYGIEGGFRGVQVSDTDFKWAYTFSVLDVDKDSDDIIWDADYPDASILQGGSNDPDGGGYLHPILRCEKNRVDALEIASIVDDSETTVKYALNDGVFFSKYKWFETDDGTYRHELEHCAYNRFGNSHSFTLGVCCGNKTGTSCYGFLCGNNCSSWTCGNFVNAVAVPQDYVSYFRLESGTQYISIKSSGTPTASKPLKNFIVKPGFVGTSAKWIELTIDAAFPLNSDYEWIIAKNSKGEIKQYCEADLID